MAAITPTKLHVISMGNKLCFIGEFSAIGATDTWATGLVTINGAFITDGAAGGITGGATYSGGTVTFALSGSMANARVMVVGS